jgi:predicted DNA-binding transcriptional regulator AlpA
MMTMKNYMPASGDPRYLTINDLAERYQVSPGTVYQWHMRGRGPRAVKLGKFIRYPIAEVLAWERAALDSLLADERTSAATFRKHLPMIPGQMASELIRGLDGPHADEHTSAAADLAAETIRYLNYATGPHAGTGVTEPVTVHAVLGGLATTVTRLPQIFGQLAGWLDREQSAGHLADDCGGPVAVLIDRTRKDLDDAVYYASELARVLSAAQSSTGHLHRA